VSPPSSGAFGYSGTPLPDKLGIKPGHLVFLDAPPPGFDLAPLPDRVAVTRSDEQDIAAPEAADVIVAFCRDRASLLARLAPLRHALAPSASLWIAWPKKAAKVPTDLGEAYVREYGLSTGLVDVKVCAVDQTWSALKFVHRLSDRP